MADIDVSVQQPTRSGSGLTPSYTAAAASNNYLIKNDGRTILHAKNTGGSPVTLTVITPGQVDGNTVADLTATVPATTGDKLIGPFPPAIYNDANGEMTVTVSGATSLAAIRV